MSGQFNVYAERPDVGTTIQNPSVALLCVDSADLFQANTTLTKQMEEFSNSTPYNSIIYKKQALMAGAISRIGLTEVNFNWSVPTINGYNNKFSVTLYSPVPASVVVEVGIRSDWYNFTDLAAEITTALNAAGVVGVGGNWSVTVQPDTFFFDVKYTIAGGELWNNLRVNINDLSTMLGFNGQTYDRTAANFLEIIGNFPSLTYTPYIDIVSSRLTKNQHIYDNSTSSTSPSRALLARLYLNPDGVTPRVDEDFIIGRCPFTIHKEYAYPKQIAWQPTENIDSIDLEIIDSKGRLLFSDPVTQNEAGTIIFVGNSATYQLTLQVSEN